MTEYIVGHVLTITYHHLLLKICTCGTIRGCATIKINYENKVICIRIVVYIYIYIYIKTHSSESHGQVK